MPEYIQEFFLSDAARAQDQGEWQFTVGVDSRRTSGTSTMLQMEYGVTKRLQLNFSAPYTITTSENSEISRGWTSTSLGIRYQILRSDSPFALSFGTELRVPVSSKSGLEYEPAILAEKTFRKLQVHLNVVADIEKGKTSVEYNIASVYAVGKRWFPTMEFNGRRLGAKNAFYVTPGLYRRCGHRTEVGMGMPTGIGGAAAPVGVIAKVNWEFGGASDRD